MKILNLKITIFLKNMSDSIWCVFFLKSQKNVSDKININLLLQNESKNEYCSSFLTLT